MTWSTPRRANSAWTEVIAANAVAIETADVDPATAVVVDGEIDCPARRQLIQRSPHFVRRPADLSPVTVMRPTDVRPFFRAPRIHGLLIQLSVAFSRNSSDRSDRSDGSGSLIGRLLKATSAWGT